MNRFILISGCSGGGKSTLLVELKRRGYTIVDEPGRRVIADERKNSGRALPWVNLAAFVERTFELALQDLNRVKDDTGLVFFDRGLIDAAVAREHITGRPVSNIDISNCYNRHVFLVPPWPQIYRNDEDRKHSFKEAKAEYERLLIAFDLLGYDIKVLPKTPVVERADLVLRQINLLP